MWLTAGHRMCSTTCLVLNQTINTTMITYNIHKYQTMASFTNIYINNGEPNINNKTWTKNPFQHHYRNIIISPTKRLQQQRCNGRNKRMDSNKNTRNHTRNPQNGTLKQTKLNFPTIQSQHTCIEQNNQLYHIHFPNHIPRICKYKA